MAQEHCKVTVVMPVYNVSRFLAACLDSILGQSLADIEVICADGGSTDNSREILQQYAKKDARVQVILRDDSSYGGLVNACMDAAHGEYIGLVESDDKIEPYMYAQMYQACKANRLDWVRADFFYSSDVEFREGAIIPDKAFYNRVLDPAKDDIVARSDIKTWCALYRRDFLNQHKLRHNVTPGAAFQDVGFWLRTMYYAHRVMFLHQPYYLWRQNNPGSSIHLDSERLIARSNHEWELEYDYLVQHPELADYKQAYAYRLFCSYMWVLDTVGADARPDFLASFQKTLQKLQADGALTERFFRPGMWETERMKQILDDPGTVLKELQARPQKHVDALPEAEAAAAEKRADRKRRIYENPMLAKMYVLYKDTFRGGF